MKRINSSVSLLQGRAPKILRQRKSNVGNAHFYSFGGNLLLTAQLEHLDCMPIVEWVQRQTMVKAVQVVRGDSIVGEFTTFQHLRDHDVLYVCFHECRLPVLDIVVSTLHRDEFVKLDLAPFHLEEEDIRKVHQRLNGLMQKCLHDRWALSFQGIHLLSSDILPPSILVGEWLESWMPSGFGAKSESISVILTPLRPIVQLVRSPGEAYMVDLEAVNVQTTSQLLELVTAVCNRQGITDARVSYTLNRVESACASSSWSEISWARKDLDAHVFTLGLRNHERLAVGYTTAVGEPDCKRMRTDFHNWNLHEVATLCSDAGGIRKRPFGAVEMDLE